MSYEIKTAYQAVVPTFMALGRVTQGWYWDQDVAERMANIADQGIRKGRVLKHQVIVIGKEALLATVEQGQTSVQKIKVRGGSDEELREATLERLPEAWKDLLGFAFNPEKRAAQNLEPDELRPKLRALVFDINPEEARVLGLSKDKSAAERELDEALEAHRKRHEG